MQVHFVFTSVYVCVSPSVCAQSFCGQHSTVYLIKLSADFNETFRNDYTRAKDELLCFCQKSGYYHGSRNNFSHGPLISPISPDRSRLIRFALGMRYNECSFSSTLLNMLAI